MSSALVNQSGQIKRKKTVSFTKAPDGKQGILLIKRLVKSINCKSIAGIGLAVPGCVDTDKGIVLADSPNLIGWRGINIKKPLEKEFKVSVVMDNDANLAAWGEKCWGAGKKVRNLICLTLGTGVGGGIIIDNKIYRGSHFYAAEIGHMMVKAEGPVCSCTRRGHLEALVSATAIVRDYKKLKIQFNIKNISAKDVFNAARKGDNIARHVVSEAARYLGLGVASLINVFDPEMVVIGGGVANAGDILFRPLRKAVQDGVMRHAFRKPKVLPAKLGENAGLLGAAALVFGVKNAS